MEEKTIVDGKPMEMTHHFVHHADKPIWQQKRTCDQCRFCDQDVDTFPCDRCHIRH